MRNASTYRRRLGVLVGQKFIQKSLRASICSVACVHDRVCLSRVTRLHAQTAYAADAKANAIEGAAVVEACAGCLSGNRVGMIGNGNANYLRIKGISVPTTGTYVVALYYTEGTDGGARSFTLQINNGAGPTLSNLAGSSWTAPAGPVIFEASFTVGNTNSVGFFNATGPAPNVDHIVVSASPLEASNAPTTMAPTVYEGDAPGNTFSGSAVIEDCTGCADGTRVGLLGGGAGNSVTINGITVPSTGVYSVTLYYVEGMDGDTREFDVVFGDGSDLSLNNLTGSSWDAPANPVTFLANFTAGSKNTLRIYDCQRPGAVGRSYRCQRRRQWRERTKPREQQRLD